MSQTTRLLSLIITIAFIAVAGFGLMAMPSHHHEVGCPFMPGEQVVCPMNAFDHISAWQNMFTTTLPTLVVLLLAIAFVVLIPWENSGPPRVLVRSHLYRRDGPTLPPSLYQELFSSGILHPKIP